jgi:hypothetical protein
VWLREVLASRDDREDNRLGRLMVEVCGNRWGSPASALLAEGTLFELIKRDMLFVFTAVMARHGGPSCPTCPHGMIV